MVNNSIINNNNNNNNNNNRVVDSIYTYYYYKYNIITLINSNNYNSIMYIAMDKGFIYDKEIRDTLGICNTYLEKLKSLKILIPTSLTNEQKIFLMKIKGNMNEVQINKMNFYKLEPTVIKILNNDFIIDIFENNVLTVAKELKYIQLELYKSILDKEKEEQDKKELQWQHKKRLLENQGMVFNDVINNLGYIKK